MERVRRPRISTAEKTEVWTRWKRGESLSDIGRALDRVPGKRSFMYWPPAAGCRRHRGRGPGWLSH